MRAAIGAVFVAIIGVAVGVAADWLTGDVFVAGVAAFWAGFILAAVAASQDA